MPQWVSGANLFDVSRDGGDDAVVGVTFSIVAALMGAAVSGVTAWTLWRWLVRGQPPKAAVLLAELLRTWRGKRGGDGGVAAPVSKKLLLDAGDPGMELSSTVPAWSKVCVLASAAGYGWCWMHSSWSCMLTVLPRCRLRCATGLLGPLATAVLTATCSRQ